MRTRRMGGPMGSREYSGLSCATFSRRPSQSLPRHNGHVYAVEVVGGVAQQTIQDGMLGTGRVARRTGADPVVRATAEATTPDANAIAALDDYLATFGIRAERAKFDFSGSGASPMNFVRSVPGRNEPQ